MASENKIVLNENHVNDVITIIDKEKGILGNQIDDLTDWVKLQEASIQGSKYADLFPNDIYQVITTQKESILEFFETKKTTFIGVVDGLRDYSKGTLTAKSSKLLLDFFADAPEEVKAGFEYVQPTGDEDKDKDKDKTPYTPSAPTDDGVDEKDEVEEDDLTPDITPEETPQKNPDLEEEKEDTPSEEDEDEKPNDEKEPDNVIDNNESQIIIGTVPKNENVKEEKEEEKSQFVDESILNNDIGNDFYSKNMVTFNGKKIEKINKGVSGALGIGSAVAATISSAALLKPDKKNEKFIIDEEDEDDVEIIGDTDYDIDGMSEKEYKKIFDSVHMKEEILNKMGDDIYE